MALKDKSKWNSKYAAKDCLVDIEPCSWLKNNQHFLTGKGNALDIAMGEGRNALFAASLGYNVLGIDISDVGIERAEKLSHEKGITIQTRIADLDSYSLPENEFDLIMCFYFLNRDLFPQIRKGLKSGGFLLFETFNVDYLKYSSFKKEWVLDHNELIKEFIDLHILNYREVDDPEEQTAFSSLVAVK